MLGLTVFESVLERLKAEAREAAEETGDTPEDGDAYGVRGLPTGFAGLGRGTAFASGAQAAAAYLDLGGETPELPAPPPPPPPPPHLLRIAPEEVAADLALTGKETVATLLARRRTFARDNHPDRAPPELRANATLRMKVANMLIDETIRRMETERRLGMKR